MKCRQGLPATVQGLTGAKPAGEKGPEQDVPYEVPSREGDRQLWHKVVRARCCLGRVMVGSLENV